jgi:hypothetical protein
MFLKGSLAGVVVVVASRSLLLVEEWEFGWLSSPERPTAECEVGHVAERLGEQRRSGVVVVRETQALVSSLLLSVLGASELAFGSIRAAWRKDDVSSRRWVWEVVRVDAAPPWPGGEALSAEERLRHMRDAPRIFG